MILTDKACANLLCLNILAVQNGSMLIFEFSMIWKLLPLGYLVPDNVNYAQTSSSHHCLVPRGRQGLHSPATASLPAILDVLCAYPLLDILDHSPAFPWYYR